VHAEALEPGGDVHTRLPAAIATAPVYLTGIAGRALGISVAGRRPKSRYASCSDSREIPLMVREYYTGPAQPLATGRS